MKCQKMKMMLNVSSTVTNNFRWRVISNSFRAQEMKQLLVGLERFYATVIKDYM